jgi:MFS transporter, DHA3 family, multidrug efflux protein
MTTTTASPTFKQLLANTLVSGVTSSFMWFALTFWVYLETHSVVATGIIGGAFSLSSALLAPIFGTFVDRHRKHTAMVLATAVAVACIGVAAATYLVADSDDLLRLGQPWFWVLVASTLVGSVAGSMRGIALSTCVSILVPEERRDRANGMVGTVSGVSFAITSVFSGLVVGHLGMGWAYGFAFVLMTGALVHLRTIRFDEPEPAPAASDDAPFVDVRGAVAAIRAVPGLSMLIFLAAFNNLLGGVFMALTDAYGLSLVSVETWGFLFGFACLAFIGGGIYVARRGLGRSPLRAILAANLAIWTAGAVFTLRSSVVLLTVGLVVWLALIPVIEAGEQTVLQRSIPFERQGRVFGFAQFVEQAAAPLTAFLVAPLAEAVFMPTMTDGLGAELIGGWFGTGAARGLALMFTLAGIAGIVVTVLVRMSRSFRALDVDDKPSVSEEAAPAPLVEAIAA